MKKEVNIVFIDDELEQEFLSLSEDDFLKKRIRYVIERIKEKFEIMQFQIFLRRTLLRFPSEMSFMQSSLKRTLLLEGQLQRD